MLADVLAAIDAAGHEPTVVSTSPLSFDGELESVPSSVSVEIDDRALTDAVDARLPDRGGDPIAVVMADLALATPAALESLFATDADVAIAPGRAVERTHSSFAPRVSGRLPRNVVSRSLRNRSQGGRIARGGRLVQTRDRRRRTGRSGRSPDSRAGACTRLPPNVRLRPRVRRGRVGAERLENPAKEP